MLITLLTVLLGIPAVLFAWIGGVLVTEAWGLQLSPTQVLTGILSAITGAVLWPLALRRLYRAMENRRSAGGSTTPSSGEAVVRAVAVVLGAVGIMALSGPLDLVAAVRSAGAIIAIGPRENGVLLQLVATIAILLLAAPALVVTQRALRRMPADDPRRARMEERQNWHFAAATAWVVSLLVGYLLSIAALMTM